MMEQQAQPTQAATRKPVKTLILQSIAIFLIASIVLGAMLCLLAGTPYYWQGWAFAILFAGLTNAQGIYLGIKDPELLERRKQVSQEGQSRGQKIFTAVALLANFGMMALSALDYRFGLSQMPVLVSVIGAGLMVSSFVVYYFVFEENSYAATLVKTFEGQKVVTTGPYALVRHPKYVGDLFLVIGTPLTLGSWWALVFVVITIPALAWRILDEEKLLKKDLPGYIEYTRKVRYRLVPYVW